MMVKLLASYFKNSSFHDINGCPLAQAIKDAFKTDDVNVGIYSTHINRELHLHEAYYPETYEKDRALALATNFDNTVIRQIDV